VGSGRVVVKALCYKPAGRGFENRLGKYMWEVPAALGSGDYSASNRNEYHKNNVSGE
jgi:hypothetical protein